MKPYSLHIAKQTTLTLKIKKLSTSQILDLSNQ